jgi:hypothetical protein
MKMAKQYPMTKYDLSILIPARNEMFLARTIQDILENIEGNTEIITVLDGAWADPGIPDNDRVTIVYLPESVGQRAATNIACKLSSAKYVMKADAHTAWDKGFDVKMMEDMQDDWTMVPVMRNLHAFDWVCEDGHRRYQGPSGPCKDCGKETTRDVVWIAKKSPQSTAYRFDTEMHFQYHGEWKKKQQGDLVETPSLQGSAFMCTREKYWELELSEESLGSWGQQGVEVAMKTWLSGGRVIVNKRTWYAHMFRTQGGDFSFPYPQRPMSEIVATREKTRELFVNGTWPKAKHDFAWYLDKFKPLPGWHDNTVDKNIGDMEIPDDTRKGIIFFTDNRLNLKIAHAVQKQLKRIGLPIISSSLKPMTFGDKNVVIDAERGYHTYFKQIVAALETSTAEIVFFCEHDVLYPPEHFEFTPPTKDKFYYNQNWVKMDWETKNAVSWEADQVSGLVCYRELALDHYRKVLAAFNPETFKRSFEPGSGKNSEAWMSKVPYLDIRQPNALTKSKWSLADFRDKSTAKNFRQTNCPEWALPLIP